jgi:hypothetical protein
LHWISEVQILPSEQKTQEMINDLIREIQAIQAKADSYSSLKLRYDNLKAEVQRLNERMVLLIGCERKLILLEHASDHRICDGCDGNGGGVCGDEFSGFDEWVCEKCEGSGIVKKD